MIDGDLHKLILIKSEFKNGLPIKDYKPALFLDRDGVIIEDNQWVVDGSKGNRYVVEWNPYSKSYSCNCKGFMFRKKCRHIEELSASFKRKLYE